MSKPPTAPIPPDDADPDDAEWLDLLAGRSAEDARRDTRREAAWLRAALLAYPAQAPQGQPSPPEQRIARLLAQAQQAGVLPASDAPGSVPRPAGTAIHQQPAPPASLPQRRQPRPAWTWALAATVAGITVFGALRWTGLPGLADAPADATAPGGTLRGQALQQRRSAQPQADRDQLLAQLRDAGLDARPFDRLGRPGIDVELPVPLPEALRSTLARLQIAPPGGPALQIEFVPTESSSR